MWPRWRGIAALVCVGNLACGRIGFSPGDSSQLADGPADDTNLPDDADADGVAPTSGLIHHWTFDGTSIDAVGGCDGTLRGNTAYGTGIAGSGVVLDGTGDYVSTSCNSPGAEGSAITIAAWIKINNVNHNSTLTIVAKRRSGFNQWRLYVDSATLNNAVPELAIQTDTTSGPERYAPSTGAFPTDLNWHHVAATYDGTDVRLYGDGGLISTPRAQTGMFDIQPNNICIGTAGDSCNEVGDFFEGAIDDVRIYDRGLSATEVMALYLATGG